jgi:hypothetical protein
VVGPPPGLMARPASHPVELPHGLIPSFGGRGFGFAPAVVPYEHLQDVVGPLAVASIFVGVALTKMALRRP